jgi:cytoskeletal protein CcmA (bactofilin family)
MKEAAQRWQRRSVASNGGGLADETSSAAADEQKMTTFFAEGCQVDGKLVMRAPIRIEGEFRGAIECGDTVTVGPEASVEGAIHARSVLIFGAVVGDVDASREVVIHATGRLHGDVETPSLEIERGAFFNGQTRMYRPELIARSGFTPAESSPETSAYPVSAP